MKAFLVGLLLVVGSSSVASASPVGQEPFVQDIGGFRGVLPFRRNVRAQLQPQRVRAAVILQPSQVRQVIIPQTQTILLVPHQ